MKYLYKYPQCAFPYANLVETNRNRGKQDFEYELLDTGVFDQDRYFDVFVEYAKESPQDILIQVTIHNRGPEPAEIHVLPTLWFRNLWSWSTSGDRPALRQADGAESYEVIAADDPALGEFYLYCDGNVPLLFTENETNTQRIFGVPNRTPYVKDGINNYVVQGQTGRRESGAEGHESRSTLSPARSTRAASALFACDSPTSSRPTSREPTARTARSAAISRRSCGLACRRPTSSMRPSRHPLSTRTRRLSCGRHWRACCGRSSSTYYDVDKWLEERGSDPFKPTRKAAPRNDHWHHMYNGDVISMPDKWEYPWYAAWDLAFHVLALTLVDPDFGKQQLKLMLREQYMHPNGQIPAYEWNFGDVNPPVHAWSTIFTYRLEKAQTGQGDRDWLKSSFQKLLLNFTWWVNRKDRSGRNVFEGGFLGLDNIGVFDRSAPCRPEAIWNRPTAPPGWPSFARTCSKSPWSWR